MEISRGSWQNWLKIQGGGLQKNWYSQQGGYNFFLEKPILHTQYSFSSSNKLLSMRVLPSLARTTIRKRSLLESWNGPGILLGKVLFSILHFSINIFKPFLVKFPVSRLYFSEKSFSISTGKPWKNWKRSCNSTYIFKVAWIAISIFNRSLLLSRTFVR